MPDMNLAASAKTLPVETGSAVVDLINTQSARIRELENENELLRLVASYAKDVVDFWPTMSIRLIRVMIPKMDNLKEALKLVK